MAKIEIYSKEWCPYCTKAKALLRSKGLAYEEIDVTSDAEGELEMIERSGRHKVPKIFIDDEPSGGFDALSKMNLPDKLA